MDHSSFVRRRSKSNWLVTSTSIARKVASFGRLVAKWAILIVRSCHTYEHCNLSKKVTEQFWKSNQYGLQNLQIFIGKKNDIWNEAETLIQCVSIKSYTLEKYFLDFKNVSLFFSFKICKGSNNLIRTSPSLFISSQ